MPSTMLNSWRFILCLVTSLMLASCAHRQETFYFGDYSQAEALYNRGEYEKAIQKYQAYMDQNPEGNLAVIARYYIAKSHTALGRTEEAKRIYQRIVEEKPDVIWANFAETQLKELEAPPENPPQNNTPLKSS